MCMTSLVYIASSAKYYYIDHCSLSLLPDFGKSAAFLASRLATAILTSVMKSFHAFILCATILIKTGMLCARTMLQCMTAKAN